MKTKALPEGGWVVASLYNEGWPVYNTNHSYGDLKCPKLDIKNTFNFPPILLQKISRQKDGRFPAKIIMIITLDLNKVYHRYANIFYKE